MGDVFTYTEKITRPNQVSDQAELPKVLVGLKDAHHSIDQLLDKLQPVIAYKSGAKESSTEKVQSTVLAEVESLNRRLSELLNNIDL